MDSTKRWELQYEIDSMKKQLTTQFPMSEPTMRQLFLRILTLVENILDDIDEC